MLILRARTSAVSMRGSVMGRVSAFLVRNISSTVCGWASPIPVITSYSIHYTKLYDDGKDVTFSVTAGDGAVSPASDTTVSGGQAETQFTVGSTVGVSTVTAVVTES